MANWYISPTGSDSTGTGAIGNPYATVSKAHTSASAGDTIICLDGTYTLASQTFAKNITVQAANNGLAIFDGLNGAYVWHYGGGTAQTTVVTGLVFKNVYGTAPTPSFTTFFGNAFMTFNDCKFQNMRPYTYWITSSIYYYNYGPCTMTFNRCQIDYSITSASGTGGFLYSNNYGPSYPTTMTFNDTTIINKNASGGATSVFFKWDHLTGGVTVTWKNCILANLSGNTVTYQSLTSVTPTNNQTYTDFYLITSNPAGTGVITSDPLLVDPANFNLNPRPDSPCNSTGTLV